MSEEGEVLCARTGAAIVSDTYVLTHHEEPRFSLGWFPAALPGSDVSISRQEVLIVYADAAAN